MQVLLGTVTNRMTINSCQAVPKSAHTSAHRWPTVHDTNTTRSMTAASNWLKTSNTHFVQNKNVVQPRHCMNWPVTHLWQIHVLANRPAVPDSSRRYGSAYNAGNDPHLP